MKDPLEDMTKEEIVYFLRRDYHYQFNPIKMSDVLFYRWQAKSKELQERRAESTEALNIIDLKQRDEYARQFNASTNGDEKMELFKKMEPYHKALKAWYAKDQLITKEDQELDKLYVSIDEARKLESIK